MCPLKIEERCGTGDSRDFQPDQLFQELSRHFTIAARDDGLELLPEQMGVIAATEETDTEPEAPVIRSLHDGTDGFHECSVQDRIPQLVQMIHDISTHSI